MAMRRRGRLPAASACGVSRKFSRLTCSKVGVCKQEMVGEGQESHHSHYLSQARSTREWRGTGIFFIAAQVNTDFFAIYFFNPCFRVLLAWDK